MVAPSRKEEIKQIVAPLLGKSLLAIAKENNIDVVEADLGQLEMEITPSGLILKKESGYRIYLHNNCAPNRIRFTLAHELWHYFLHRGYLDSKKIIVDDDNTLYSRPGFKDLPENIILMEQEANFFAAEILMPENVVIEAFKKNSDIYDLSKFFSVSTDAMHFRLKNLSLK